MTNLCYCAGQPRFVNDKVMSAQATMCWSLRRCWCVFITIPLRRCLSLCHCLAFSAGADVCVAAHALCAGSSPLLSFRKLGRAHLGTCEF